VNGVRSQDLVLVVSEQSDFDIAPYERFLDQLTHEGGGHQNEALHVAGRYLLGGHYADLFAVAAENWERSEEIREHHGHDRARFMGSLELGSLLAGSIDHATGTGKSYVIFGAAMLALGSGHVDRVLVLCPSLTIEEGLTAKFKELVRSPELMYLLPAEAVVRLPAIVNAYEGTVPVGSICVENIHAAYDGSASSIRDSFREQGDRTLIINDEAHHIYRTKLRTGGDAKEWAKFLLNPEFGFRRVLNVSGTCFIDNAYFADVIHRYGLQQARAEKRIKDIFYWESDRDFPDDQARAEAVIENHLENQRRYTEAKPITIFVAATIKGARQLREAFVAFLAAKTGISPEEAAELCLVVTSDPADAANVAVLRGVDAAANPVQFIFSVSMLSEGWDVKNVLQIVPSEKRAFDSKLLISQVLGRGLRLLPRYHDARVVVFNHASWAPEMRRLFDDVWYDEQRIHSTPVVGDPHHFSLDLLEIERGTATTAAAATAKGRAAGEPLRLMPQHTVTTAGQLTDLAGRGEDRRYRYTEPVKLLGDFMAEVEAKLMAPMIETGEAPELEITTIRTEVEMALAAAHVTDGEISRSNQERVLTWLAHAPRAPRRATVRIVRETLETRSTADLTGGSIGRSELARDTTIALRTDNDRAIRLDGHEVGQYELLDEILTDQNRRLGAVAQVTDARVWRTPVDVVIVSFGPERAFLDGLLRRPNACGIDDWIKSPDSSFYGVPYTLTRAGVTRNQTFNPDWFLRRGDEILVVETKADGDASEENKAKLRGATEWFDRVNALLEAAGSPRRYSFCFLGQSDVDPFFDALCDGRYATFLSRLQAELTPAVAD
jgi:type III restriction enzyme